MRRIIFNLKREWYEKIAAGEKTVEYRRICDHWIKRLGFVRAFAVHSDWTDEEIDPFRLNSSAEIIAVFRLGYSRQYPDIIRRVTKIDIGPCPYKGWDGKFFRIHFDAYKGDVA